MTLVQRIFARAMPRGLAARMEAESRAWMARCPCGFEQSIWERGGVRWGSAGKPKQLLKCPSCDSFTLHSVVRKAGAVPDNELELGPAQ